MERYFHRYVVVKVAHAEQALSQEELKTLYGLGQKVYNWQHKQGKPAFECVVVEHDWPEYEKVWQMIEARVDSKEAEDQGLEEWIAGYEAWKAGYESAKRQWSRSGEISYLRGIGAYCNGWNRFAKEKLDEGR